MTASGRELLWLPQRSDWSVCLLLPCLIDKPLFRVLVKTGELWTTIAALPNRSHIDCYILFSGYSVIGRILVVHNVRRPKAIHFILLLLIFALVYFGVSLPLFQRFSLWRKARRFTVRLGSPWNARDPNHRWDVAMSFLSFVVALAISMILLDQLVPFQKV